MTSFIQPVKVRGYATNGIDLICKPVDEGPFCFVKPPYGGLDRAYFEALGHATTSRNQYAPAVARITNGTQAELLPPASFVRHQDSDHLLVLDTNFDEDILQSGRTDNGRDRTFISTMWSIDIPPPGYMVTVLEDEMQIHTYEKSISIPYASLPEEPGEEITVKDKAEKVLRVLRGLEEVVNGTPNGAFPGVVSARVVINPTTEGNDIIYELAESCGFIVEAHPIRR